ncbi:MAG: bifunctional phosphoglucose/phosphomannose isomerase [Chloroflexi bacterium]|nr:bifunctional phosphoglucose/phosphomannose isomerase [Chloroflexota bacterium]
MTTPDLDDPSLYPLRDPAGMGSHLKGFSALCQAGWEAAGRLHLPVDYRRVTRIVFLGMGGSAIAGEMAACLLRTEANAPPSSVHRDYGVPSWVDRETLVLVSSYSGETEETLSGVEPALARGAKLLALTHGGKLAQVAQKEGFPWYPIALDAPPRATLPYMLTSILRLLRDLGLCEDRAGEVREASQLLLTVQAELGPATPASRNVAKRLAQELRGRVPIIYGAGLLAPVARRWKTQINENAKAWAFAEEIPEAHHNSIVGLALPADLRGRLAAVLLVPAAADRRTLLRFQVTREILEDHQVLCEAVTAVGTTPVAQMLSASLYGDYVSYYLALLNDVDPTPIVNVDRVKRRLEE